MGDSRYVVEPNIKEGKGGLRDLQTLYWIGKYIHQVRSASELVDVGLFTSEEYRSFRRAERFLLAVRCHLHQITGRAEDRLTFDFQRQIAERMNFADRPGKSAVERFMQFYFLQANRVGSLTGVFLAHIDDQFAQRASAAASSPGFRARPARSRATASMAAASRSPSDDWFRKDPVRLIEMFQLADLHSSKSIRWRCARRARCQADRQPEVPRRPRANALFLEC
jgi:[protein-PII] uridylyltransferase